MKAKRSAEWLALKAQRRAVFFRKRREEAMALVVSRSADEVRALIERDFIPDEETCLTANPKGRATYYERVNGGPWIRRY